MAADPALATLASTIEWGPFDGKVSWDDLKAFMAVAVHGSLNRAGAALRESQPTVGRRITRLETALGLALLRRGVNAVTLTEAGHALLRATAPMANAAREIDAVITAHRPRFDAPIRITATTSVSMFVSRQLPVLRAASVPREVLILPSRRVFDLDSGEAEIALRMRSLPTSKGLLARKLGTVVFAIYGTSGDEALPMIMPSNHSSVSRQYGLAQRVLATRPVGPEIDEMHLRYQAVKSGVGVGCLPCFLGESDPELSRIYDGPTFEVHDDLYLVRHERTKADPAVEAVAAAIVKLFRRHRSELCGRQR